MAAAWENLTSTEDKAAAMAVSLPDDALLEILLRVGDAAALFRCAIACKRWCGLVRDPSFLRRWWPENACPSLAGFFVQNQRGAKMLVPTTPWSALPRGIRHTISDFVVPAETANLLSLCHAEPLVSRRGLLLVRLVPSGAEAMGSRVAHMAVCNLLDGTCNALPPLRLDCDARHFYYERPCYAVLTGEDCHDEDVHPPPPSFYRVLIVTARYTTQWIDHKFDLKTFSSDEESWSTRRLSLHGTIRVNDHGSYCQRDAVVRHGAAHWLFCSVREDCYYLVKLDLQEHYHFSFTRLPIHSYPPPCLSLATDGTLSVLQMEGAGHRLVIWRQEENQRSVDSSTTQWVNTRTIELIGRADREIVCVLGEKGGKLLVKDWRGRVYAADLETGAMEKVKQYWSHVRPDGNPVVVRSWRWTGRRSSFHVLLLPVNPAFASHV